jgi:two-component system, OmpR family, response regulator
VSRVLVVDDDPDIRLLLRFELAAEGHEILEAGDGQEALAAIGAGGIDVVLLDMMMPVLDGWGVLRELDPATAPPVVVITALASDGDRHVIDLLELGAVDVIAKPFDPGMLVRLVDAVLLVDDAERDEYRRRRLSRVRGTG